MKPRSTHNVSATAALLSPVLPAVAADHWAPMSMYDRRVPYSVCVRRSTLMPLRTRKPKFDVSVRVSRPPGWPPAAPIGTSLLSLFHDVWTRTNEPIFKHVSVPGTYQKPAPYRLQTFTYSTGLAFTGRSAACAPATATRPAAEPRRRLFTIFIVTSKFLLIVGGFRSSDAETPWKVPFSSPRNHPALYFSSLRCELQSLDGATWGCPPPSRVQP